VILAVPVTADSLLVTGGTSFAGDSEALNTGVVATGVGVVDDELPQPAAMNASATASTDNRFIVKLSF